VVLRSIDFKTTKEDLPKKSMGDEPVFKSAADWIHANHSGFSGVNAELVGGRQQMPNIGMRFSQTLFCCCWAYKF
jgi:hypothetical protein